MRDPIISKVYSFLEGYWFISVLPNVVTVRYLASRMQGDTIGFLSRDLT